MMALSKSRTDTDRLGDYLRNVAWEHYATEQIIEILNSPLTMTNVPKLLKIIFEQTRGQSQ